MASERKQHLYRNMWARDSEKYFIKFSEYGPHSVGLGLKKDMHKLKWQVFLNEKYYTRDLTGDPGHFRDLGPVNADLMIGIALEVELMEKKEAEQHGQAD